MRHILGKDHRPRIKRYRRQELQSCREPVDEASVMIADPFTLLEKRPDPGQTVYCAQKAGIGFVILTFGRWVSIILGGIRGDLCHLLARVARQHSHGGY